MISLIVTLIIIGVLLFLLNTLVPMDAKIKTLVNAIIIIAVCVWVLEGFGLLTGPTWGHHGRWS